MSDLNPEAFVAAAVAKKQNDSQPATLQSARASSYKMAAVSWVWLNRFALGKLGLIGGLPDRGKGLITADIIARVTRGAPWPCEEGWAIQGRVLLLTAEDDIADTVVPRLVAANADLDKVEIIKMVRQGDASRMFSLVTDLALLKQKIEELGDVVLIVIDPVSAYLGLGKIDSYRTTDVRAVLAPVTDLATEKRLSIIGIMHFNKKDDVTNAMLRIADSLAYVAAARHCYVVVDDPENERRLFIKAKNNLAPDTKALSYNVGVIKVGHDEDLKKDIYAPHIVWGTEHVDVTATEAMQAENGGGSQPGAKDEARQFLEQMLANGPVTAAEVYEAAEANCISQRTLNRAKKELNVVSSKDGMKHGWTWALPPKILRWDQKSDAEDA
jgi:hypothetical protein